jgi:hypothetical protein
VDIADSGGVERELKFDAKTGAILSSQIEDEEDEDEENETAESEGGQDAERGQ